MQEMDRNKKQVNLKDVLEVVDGGQVNVITATKELLDGKDHVTLNLASKPITPERMETPPRCHAFDDADAFCRYVLRYGRAGHVLVTGNAEELECRAILDESRTDGIESVFLQMSWHPTLEALRNSFSSGDVWLAGMLSVPQFAAWVLENQRAVLKQTYLMLFKNIRASRKFDAFTGVGNMGRNGFIVTHEVKAGASSGVAQEEVDLPASLTFSCPLFIGDEKQTSFDVDITVKADPDGISIKLASPDLQIKCLARFKGRMLEIEKQLKDIDAIVSLGRSAHHTSWNYI
jgi:hypothetical protein